MPDGWDDALVGRFGGLTVSVLIQQAASGGEVAWNFAYQRDASSVRISLRSSGSTTTTPTRTSGWRVTLCAA